METIIKGNKVAISHAPDFAWRERDGVRALVCTALENNGFVNAFSTRLGGVSPMPAAALNLAGFVDDATENIYENRRRFLALFDDSETDWRLATGWQVHGADVRRVRAEWANDTDKYNDEERCDALTTDVAGVLVGVKHADCVPVLLGDVRTGACAAVHAGWRGTVAEIVIRTLEQMREAYSTRPEDVSAAIGPAALLCCYEVGAEVIGAFREQFSYTDDLFIPTRAEHARIDLHLANRKQLIGAGVRAANIFAAPFCAMHDNNLFFSYRREKHAHGRVGRLLSVIGRAPTTAPSGAKEPSPTA